MIKCERICFSYPNSPVQVLRDISVVIQEGEAVSIMGANGSGKSTLARCLNGLLQPSSGEVWIGGLNTRHKADNEKIRQKVGMVFQNPDHQIVSTTVEREVAFGMENLQFEHDEMHATVDHLLEEFNLKGRLDHPPHRLSGGEKQLLCLASVLAMKPRYLILDEPTSLLDPYSRRRILESIFKNRSKSIEKLTPILITQYPEETFYTNRLLILSEGKIISDAAPHEAFKEAGKLCRLGIGVPLEYALELEIDLDDHRVERHSL
jgi:energy-coupling factor transport system ATP-binding protein